MGFEEITFSWSFVQWVVVVAIGIYAWFVGWQSAKGQELAELRVRLAELEQKLKQVPTASQLTEMARLLERTAARVEATAESIQPLARSLERINDYLLKNK